MPKVSVLLTSYNRGAMLSRAIASVLTQDMRDFELLLLDDNSPGGSYTRQVIGRQADPRIWVLQSRIRDADRALTARYAVMINQGLALASGDYITYLCDDDFYLPHRLARLAGALDANPAWSVVYGPQLITDQHGTRLAVRPADEVLHEAAYRVDHCSVMHRWQAARDAGGWDTDPDGLAVGDARFWARLNQAGYPFYPVPGDPLEVSVRHPGTLTQVPDEQLIYDRLSGKLR
jgi:spore maturation protein CgeD